MNITEIIRRWHYPAEEHEVLTEDGFILSVNRIPQGRRHAAGTRPAVLLQHGLLAAGSNWISNPPNTSLGYVLADAGYDVWLGNSRGNTWSRKHQSLRPDQEEFWRFSKIRLFVGLAPVATVAFTSSPMTKMSILPEPLIWTVFGRRDFLPQSHMIEWFAEHVCGKQRLSELCGNLFFILCGFDENNLNMSTAPEYQVQNMKVPTALFSGGQDTLADPKDVAVLLTQVSNLVFHQHIDHWEHLDFIWGLDAPEQMFPSILKLLHENC
ncbi:hypothetical protein F2P81_022849 [Scophthalmus maximus]|uniref:Partial AB-hydrolase lipase domain-containing protein n=1 Tax=Scophthalmus maximus TaxID=52904 RepID=A0A6A4S1E2_SCOMX|nr:hypothetical protein F2P81_022849 [Scophthalmus maximus]